MLFSGKRAVVCAAVLLVLMTSGVSGVRQSGGTRICDRAKPSQILVLSDAERILGQSARLTSDTTTLKGEVRQCMCSYTGAAKDKATGQDSVLYFSLEEKEKNPTAAEARQILVSTKELNAPDHEILDLSGIGDEAFALSNNSDSHLILARKGAVIMRLQVKRSAGSNSFEEVKSFAARVFKNL